MVSCPKDFWRLFNKKVFTDTVVIDALVTLHGIHARLIANTMQNSHISPN